LTHAAKTKWQQSGAGTEASEASSTAETGAEVDVEVDVEVEVEAAGYYIRIATQ